MAKRGRFAKSFGGEWPNDEHVRTVVERARTAWDSDRSSFVYRQLATSTLSDEGLNDALDQILQIGWRLHSTALVYNQTAMNSEVALFTFLRPEYMGRG